MCSIDIIDFNEIEGVGIGGAQETTYTPPCPIQTQSHTQENPCRCALSVTERSSKFSATLISTTNYND